MRVVDNKMAKKFIKDIRKLNKNIDFNFIKYNGSCIFVDDLNLNKVKLPPNWSYDERLGLVYTDNNKSAKYVGEDNRYYMRTTILELSQVNDLEDLAREMQRLNPTVEVGVDYSSSEPKLTTSVGLENLNYPEGFYYNDKNGITNKHNTKNGSYLSFEAEHIDSEINDNLRLLSELQILNPTANIKIDPVSVMNGDFSTISSNISAEKLILPEGFEYNDKNGITNKHNTTTGAYISCNVEQNEIRDAYDLAREIVDLNANVKVQISNENGQSLIKTSEDIKNLKLPKDFYYHNGQIATRVNSGKTLTIGYEPPKKSIVGQVKDLAKGVADKVEETVASVKGSIEKKKTLKELNPMEFEDIKECFDKYTIGTKNGKLIAINRKTNRIVKDEELISRVQFADAWVNACGKNLSLTGNDVLGVDERQYEYAFNEGAEQTFNSMIEYIRFSAGQKVKLEDMAEHAKYETGYKYADSIVEGLFDNHSQEQLKMIKNQLSKSAQASQMKNSKTNVR